MRESTKHLKNQLNNQIVDIEKALGMDVLSIFGPILPSLDNNVKNAIESIKNKKPKLAIIHDTEGGIVEVVERMVAIIRHHYQEVIFIIPNMAMSAGTVFALSGDKIYMDYFSCLGPIDPQIEKNGVLVPALSYINQYEKIMQKAENDKVNSVEFLLFQEQFNLAELETFIQAQELTEDLLQKWLSIYKFKDWTKTTNKNVEVTEKHKQKRAKQIAKELNNYKRWHSHSRGINKQTLEEIGLKINDLSEIKGLDSLVKNYYNLLVDFIQSEEIILFVHNKEYLQ